MTALAEGARAPSPHLMPPHRSLRAAVAALPTQRPTRRPDRPAPGRETFALVDRGRAEDVPPAVARDRARFADCSRGAHVFDRLELPGGRVVEVCRYCPIPANQAARVRAAAAARRSSR